MYITIEGGKKISMPRYYKDKIYSEEERRIIANDAKLRALETEQKNEQEMLEKYGENWRSAKAAMDINQFQKMHKNANTNRNKM